MSIKEKVDDLLEKTTIDDKIIAGAEKVKDKANELLDKTEVDDKIIDKIVDLQEKLKD